MKFSFLVLLFLCIQFQLDALVANRNILWVNGQRIKVTFLQDEDKAYKSFVEKIAKTWEQHANVVFDFTEIEGGKADIKIYSDNQANPSSQLGKNSKWVARSMNLPLYDEYKKMKRQDESDYYFLVMRSAILHEFGHALGLSHEHQNPNAGICWDEPIVYKMCADSEKGIQECKLNWLEPRKGKDLVNSAYDRYSIMHYRIKNKLTSCDYDAPWNTELSMMDKRWIQFLYPFPNSLNEDVVRKFAIHSTEIKLKNFNDEWGNNTLEIFGRVGMISTHDLDTECYQDVAFPGCFEVAIDYIHLLVDIKEDQEAKISSAESSGQFLSKASFEHSANDKYFLVVKLYDKDYFSPDDHFVYFDGGFRKNEFLVIPLELFHRTSFGIMSYEISDAKLSNQGMSIQLDIDMEEVSLNAN